MIHSFAGENAAMELQAQAASAGLFESAAACLEATVGMVRLSFVYRPELVSLRKNKVFGRCLQIVGFKKSII